MERCVYSPRDPKDCRHSQKLGSGKEGPSPGPSERDFRPPGEDGKVSFCRAEPPVRGSLFRERYGLSTAL